jgi:hypothetical protein
MAESLTPRWRKGLRTVHVAVSVAVIGADLALTTLAIAGLTGDASAVYPAAQIIGAQIVSPLAVAALISGVAMALLTPYGLLRYWWVAIKLTVTTSLSAAVLFVLLPALSATAEAASAGEEIADGRQLLLVIPPTIAIGLLVLNVALAVFKPGWRLRRRSTPAVATPAEEAA